MLKIFKRELGPFSSFGGQISFIYQIHEKDVTGSKQQRHDRQVMQVDKLQNLKQCMRDQLAELFLKFIRSVNNCDTL